MKDEETIVKKIEKLPKWAQDHIKDLVRERELMLRALNDFTSNSKPSPIYIEEYVCSEVCLTHRCRSSKCGCSPKRTCDDLQTNRR